MPFSSDNQVGLILKAAGLKRTTVRIGVLRLLSTTDKPMAAAQITRALGTDTDHVTVYRTLSTLTARNMLHRIRGDDRVWRYALTRKTDPAQSKHTQSTHAHFVCQLCGSVECLRDLPLSTRVLDQFTPRKSYRINYSEVVVHGLCPQCNADRHST